VDEVTQVDKESQGKTNKKTFGNHTATIWNWFDNLPESKVKEAEQVATKWNIEGAPDKEKISM